MRAEFAEGGQYDELAGAGHYWLVLKGPSVLVRDVDGVQSHFHGGVDVAARAVADHPAMRFDDFVLVHQAAVSLSIFFRHDFDELKESLEAGALNLRGLFCGFSFGEENEPVALG